MEFRQARIEDLETIVEMLATDMLGHSREDSGGDVGHQYREAFREISADPNNELIVACLDDRVIGVVQLTFIPNMTYRGGRRLLVEGVRVADGHQGMGVGRKMMQWAIRRGREKGCRLVQLTSNKQRVDAIRFYQSLGFEATHEGLKLMLEPE